MVWVPLTFNDALHLMNLISCYSHWQNLSIPRLCRSNVYGQHMLQIYTRTLIEFYWLWTLYTLHWGHMIIWTAATKAHSVICPTVKAKFGDMPDSESKIWGYVQWQSITRASTSGPSKDSQALGSMEAISSVTQAPPMKKRKVRE